MPFQSLWKGQNNSSPTSIKPCFQKAEIFKAGGTHGPSSTTSGYISHVESNVYLPDANNERNLMKYEWVVVPNQNSTIFWHPGDSGDAVITATPPYSDLGRTIGGSSDANRLTYISDSAETLEDIEKL